MKTLRRVLLALAVLAAAIVALTPWLVKRYLPPEKLRSLASQQARKSLGRDVRVGDVAYGIWGARLSDVAVSQVPDFSAGTLVTAGQIVIRPSWLALLRRRLVVASVSAEDGKLSYTDPKSGLDVQVTGLSAKVEGFRLWGPFQVSLALTASGKRAGKPFAGTLSAAGVVDLGGSDPQALRVDLSKVELRTEGLIVKGKVRDTGLSPAQAELDLAVEPEGRRTALGLPASLTLPKARVRGILSYSGDELTLKDVTVDAGRAATLEVSGSVSGLKSKPAAALEVRCPSFDAARLAVFDADLRDLALRGAGSFQVSARGPLNKPSISGSAAVRDFGATMAGLPLSGFSGHVRFDDSSVSLSGLRGSLAGSPLQLSVTAKNYRTHPDVELQASIDRFDLGRFLDAKEKWSSQHNALPERAKPAGSLVLASPATGAALRAAPATPSSAMALDTRGKLTVGTLSHPNIEARNVSLQWSLTGAGADLSSLNGSAKISSSGGQIHTLSDASKKSKVAKVLLIPLMVLDRIGRLAGLRLLPDFSNAKYTELAGDYSFQNGVMSIKDSHLYANVGKAKVDGRIDLPRERLAIRIQTQAEQMAAPLELDVSGTFEDPKVRIKAEKLLEQGARQLIEGPLKQVLGDPAKQLLKGLFGH